jgi:hypothetical protein
MLRILGYWGNEGILKYRKLFGNCWHSPPILWMNELLQVRHIFPQSFAEIVVKILPKSTFFE